MACMAEAGWVKGRRRSGSQALARWLRLLRRRPSASSGLGFGFRVWGFGFRGFWIEGFRQRVKDRGQFGVSDLGPYPLF